MCKIVLAQSHNEVYYIIGVIKMGKSSTKAHNKYISKAYDRINLTVPKGYKDQIRQHAANLGESVNAYIKRLIDQDMKHAPGE